MIPINFARMGFGLVGWNALNPTQSVSESVTKVGLELLGQLKTLKIYLANMWMNGLSCLPDFCVRTNEVVGWLRSVITGLGRSPPNSPVLCLRPAGCTTPPVSRHKVHKIVDYALGELPKKKTGFFWEILSLSLSLSFGWAGLVFS